MRWRIVTPEEKVAKLEKWHRWFAWRPVIIGDYKYWLVSIYRRGEYHVNREWSFWTWDYCADEFEMLKRTAKERNEHTI